MGRGKGMATSRGRGRGRGTGRGRGKSKGVGRRGQRQERARVGEAVTGLVKTYRVPLQIRELLLHPPFQRWSIGLYKSVLKAVTEAAAQTAVGRGAESKGWAPNPVCLRDGGRRSVHARLKCERHAELACLNTQY